MRRQGGTFQYIGPTTVKLTTEPIKLKANVIPVVNYGEAISTIQIEILKGLRYTTGDEMINPTKGIGNDLLYEILNRLKLGVKFDSLVIFFQANWDNEDEAYFALPDFDDARYAYNKWIESYHDEREVAEGVYTCPKCKGKETFSVSKQTRSADEPETVKVICTNCQNSWTFK